MSAPTPVVPAGLRSILTALRLGQMADTLPERLAMARECSMPHVDFLEAVVEVRAGCGVYCRLFVWLVQYDW